MNDCPRCNKDFTAESRIPKVLPCGHTFCIFCLIQAFKTDYTFICDECFFQIDNIEVLRGLPTNYALLKHFHEKALQGKFQRSISRSKEISNMYMSQTEYYPPMFHLSQDSQSLSQGMHSQQMDYINFKDFEASLEEETLGNVNMTANPMPSKSRTDFHIGEKMNPRNIPPTRGRQDKPQMKDPNLCLNNGCFNKRMYIQGTKDLFCSPKCSRMHAQSSKNNTSRAASNTPVKERSANSMFSIQSQATNIMNHKKTRNESNMQMEYQEVFPKPLIRTQKTNPTQFIQEHAKPAQKFGQPSRLNGPTTFSKHPNTPSKKYIVQSLKYLGLQNFQGRQNNFPLFNVDPECEDYALNSQSMGLMRAAVMGNSISNRVPFPNKHEDIGFSSNDYGQEEYYY